MIDINELVKQSDRYRKLSFGRKMYVTFVFPFLPQMYDASTIEDFIKNKEEVDLKLTQTILPLTFVIFNDVHYRKIEPQKSLLYDAVSELEVSLRGYKPTIPPVDGARVKQAITLYCPKIDEVVLCKVIARSPSHTEKASFFEQVLLGYAELKYGTESRAGYIL